MNTDGRLAQRGLRILTGLDTKAATKANLCDRKIATIVAAAERLPNGCVVYRLDAQVARAA